jgi:glutamine cyclotransferase
MIRAALPNRIRFLENAVSPPWPCCQFLSNREQSVLSAGHEPKGKNRRGWRRFVPACAVLAAVVLGATVLLTSTETSAAAPPVIRVTKVAEFPHDRQAFSQGLAVYNEQLLEGTGRYQQSTVRRVDIVSGDVTKRVRLDNNVFGEGVTIWQDRIIQLTWENGYLIIYDADTMVRKGIVPYRQIDTSLKQGWGITHDGVHLIVSDGTPVLRFIDPSTWKIVRTIRVRSGDRFIRNLNELEYVNGEILANIWYSSRIARIEPESGRLTGWLELGHLFPGSVRGNPEAVLNGIAWDAGKQRLFVTGKLWPSVFEITFDGLARDRR